jgi:DinB superfamily
MVETLATELLDLVESAAVELRAVDGAVAAAKPGPDVWSVKEIVGHLVDSAANNHQRFVRAQEGKELAFPGYEQNGWVRSQDYQNQAWVELVDLWALYNRHLAHLIQRIPAVALRASCRIGGADSVTLGFLLEDYVVHLRHHLQQIKERRAV